MGLKKEEEVWSEISEKSTQNEVLKMIERLRETSETKNKVLSEIFEHNNQNEVNKIINKK